LEPGAGIGVFLLANSVSGNRGIVVMSKANEYRRQAEESAARVAWCEKKLSFERKRHKALNDLAVGEDWLDGKMSPVPKTESTRTGGK
jgi:hypothetical protein